MGHLVVETRVRASREIVFDLARDVGAHHRSASFSGERVTQPGRTEGLLELGEIVTFEGVHFGLRQRFTARITEMRRPEIFVDELVKAAFRSLRHVHEFEAVDGGTLMRDTLDWVSPFGILGRIADSVAIEHHMRSFLVRKQRALAEIAEETQRKSAIETPTDSGSAHAGGQFVG